MLAPLTHLLVAVVGLGASPRALPAESPQTLAAAERDRAEEFYGRQEYQKALEAIRRAHLLDPKPEYLYVIAQCERHLGYCDRAVPLYEVYLESDPPEEKAVRARANLEACRETSVAPVPSPRRPSRPPDATVSPPPRPPERMDRTWLRDPAGATLLATGLAALGTGAGLWVASPALQRRADEAGGEAAYGDAIGRAMAFERAGIALVAAGSALLLGAAIRYGLVRRRRGRPKATWLERSVRAAAFGRGPASRSRLLH